METANKIENIENDILRLLVNHAPLPIAIGRLSDERIIYLNPFFTSIFGYTTEDAPTLSDWYRLVYPDPVYRSEVARTWLPMVKASSSGKNDRAAYMARITCKDGAIRQVEIATTISGDHAIVMFTDLTERIKAEEALRESEQRESVRAGELETILDIAPVAIFMTHDLESKVVTGNRAAHELIYHTGGMREAEESQTVTLPNFKVLQNGQETSLAERPLQRAAATAKRVSSSLLTIVFEDGTKRETLNNAYPLLDREGKPRGAIGVTVDVTEQVKAKEALEESLEQARAAHQQLSFQFDQLPIAYIIWDRDACVTAWNPAAERIFGWSRDEAIGRNAFAIIAPESQQVANSMWTDLLQGNVNKKPNIINLITKDGKRITCEWFSSLMYDRSGNVSGVMSMANDITERAEREKELKIRCEAMDANLTPTIMATPEGTFTYVNKAFLDVWGFKKPSDILGKKSDGLWAEDMNLEAMRKEVVSSGCLKRVMRAKRLDGTRRMLNMFVSVIRNPDGSPLSIVGSYIDLTEHIKAEEALRESEQYNRTLFETSPIALALGLLDGTLLDVNPFFSRMTGYSHKEALELRRWQLTPEDEIGEQLRIHVNNIEETGFYGPVESEFTHKDGHRFPVKLFGTLLEMDGKKTLFSSVEDITEQRRTDEQLKQSQKLQSLGTLAGGISHELNNLLMPIIGLAELMRDDLTDEQNLRNLDDILSAAERARQMVRKILAFSHKSPLNKKRLSLEPVIEKTVEFLRVTVPSNVKIITDVEPTAQVEADEGQLQQIIMNLCANAVHAMGLKGGQLEISAAACKPEPPFFERHQQVARREYIRLAVRDTGCGIDSETLSHVFEPFFTTKQVGEGTGMGLSVVHGIIENHGGVIEIESQVGKGTAIKVYLPAAG
jgi:PAS domain S-box-containing protein